MNILNINNTSTFLTKSFEIAKHELGQNSLAIVAMTTALACAIFTLYCCATPEKKLNASIARAPNPPTASFDSSKKNSLVGTEEVLANSSTIKASNPEKSLTETSNKASPTNNPSNIELQKALPTPESKGSTFEDDRWLKDAQLWDDHSEITRSGCLLKAKDFISRATQYTASPLPKFSYFIIAQKPGERGVLSYKTFRNIQWKYHVVLTYVSGNKRSMIDPSIPKKTFPYKNWVDEITQKHPEKFSCLEINDFQGIGINPVTQEIGGAITADGRLIKIDQSVS